MKSVLSIQTEFSGFASFYGPILHCIIYNITYGLFLDYISVEMLTRSGITSSVKNGDVTAGNMNANVSAMTDQSTTVSVKLVDNNTITTSVQSAERPSMAKPNTQATQRAPDQFEITVMASLEKILAGQDQFKKRS